jgi:hypothetical protein
MILVPSAALMLTIALAGSPPGDGPDRKAAPPSPPQDQARQLVAKLLALHGIERWKMISQQSFGLRIPDLRNF